MLTHNPKSQIGFILKGYPRVSETFILNEILLLESLGHELHIVALRKPVETASHARVAQVNAKVSYIPDRFWRYIAALTIANLVLMLRRPRTYLPVFGYAARRSIRRRSSSTIKRFVQAGYFVQRIWPQTSIAHFHAHFSHGPTTVAYFASKMTGIDYSFSAHAKDIYLQDLEFLGRKIDGASFVVTCTDFNRHHLQSCIATDTPVRRVYHGVDLSYFDARRRSRSEAMPRILSVGRFVPKKGFPILLEALTILANRNLSFKCDIIGGGPLRDSLSRQVKELGLNEVVQILPAMTQSNLMPFYRAADVFSLACRVQSDGDRDGIPNVLVEAMAMEVPVVSTNISGIPELVEDNRTGLLVPENDAAALAEALYIILSQPKFASQLASAGRQKVCNDFDSRKNIEMISGLLEAVLNEGLRPRQSPKPEATMARGDIVLTR